MAKRITIEVLVGFEFRWNFYTYSVFRLLYLSTTFCKNCVTFDDGWDIYEAKLNPMARSKQITYVSTYNNGEEYLKKECYSKFLGSQSDTQSKDDSVRKQYLALPYPAVREPELREEYNHYKGTKKSTKVQPYQPVFGVELERLNHFLFEGRQNFRYQFIDTLMTMLIWRNLFLL